jgi:hypothetical protein
MERLLPHDREIWRDDMRLIYGQRKWKYEIIIKNNLQWIITPFTEYPSDGFS